MGFTQNIKLSPTYLELSPQERLIYYNKLGMRILHKRYMYYILNESTISDDEYDFLEKYYELVCMDVDQPSVVEDMVGWNGHHPIAKAVKELIDSENIKVIYEP